MVSLSLWVKVPGPRSSPANTRCFIEASTPTQNTCKNGYRRVVPVDCTFAAGRISYTPLSAAYVVNGPNSIRDYLIPGRFLCLLCPYRRGWSIANHTQCYRMAFRVEVSVYVRHKSSSTCLHGAGPPTKATSRSNHDRANRRN